jgi:hypothetical protein
MVRFIGGSKSVNPADLWNEVRSVFGDIKAYLGQKGAVLVQETERVFSSHDAALSTATYEIKDLGTINVKLQESPSSPGYAHIFAKVGITGSNRLKKESMVPENVKNILWLNGYYVGSEHDETKDEELAPIRAY